MHTVNVAWIAMRIPIPTGNCHSPLFRGDLMGIGAVEEIVAEAPDTTAPEAAQTRSIKCT